MDPDQIIEQVISLENEYSDTSDAMANVDNNLGIIMGHQQPQQHRLGDINLTGASCMPDSNQLSSSSEDLLNLLLEFDREPSNLIGLDGGQQLDPDEKAGIENIRKQLMSCEVQSDQPQHHNTTAPVIPHHLANPGPSQHRLSVDQSLLHGSYSNLPVRISQSNPMSIVSNSPSPSWQQPQLSPYSPQTPQHNNTSQQQHPTMQQHQTTTSPQMQQLHHPLQRGSQSVSPPTTTEPSPVVKKNPLLNAQLVNSRPPSITPTRFMNNQTNVLNQNPILNAKLSQSPFVSNSGVTVGSQVNSSLNPQPRFIPQQTQQSNFSYDVTQQQQSQQNAQQHTPPQQTGHMSMYRPSDQQQQQQQTNQIFRTTTAANAGIGPGGANACICLSNEASPMSMGNTSPSGGLSQQVKQEIRRKVQQPRQQPQTTSLLKQLLSDDNK